MMLNLGDGGVSLDVVVVRGISIEEGDAFGSIALAGWPISVLGF